MADSETIRENVARWNAENGNRLNAANERLRALSKADVISMDSPKGLTTHEETRREREALVAEVAILETEQRQAEGVLKSLNPNVKP